VMGTRNHIRVLFFLSIDNIPLIVIQSPLKRPDA
jgi:hypothetical protein